MLPPLLILLSVLNIEVAHGAAPIARPGCKDSCGNVSIPFPFGIGPSCSLDPWFEVDCKPSPGSNGSAKPFLSKLDIEVMELIVEYQQRMIVGLPPLNVCAANSHHQNHSGIDLRGSPYNFSFQENVFIMEGCSGSAVLVNQSETVMSGCATVCHNNGALLSTNDCYGVRCCKKPLPWFPEDYSPLQFYQIYFNPQSSGEGENCLLGSLIKSDSVNEYVGKLGTLDPSSAAPVVLLWSWISNHWPDKNPLADCWRQTDTISCFCQSNSYGNPYVFDGCQVPEECKGCNGPCNRKERNSYHCYGTSPFASSTAIYVYLGLGIAIVSALLVTCCRGLYYCIKRRRKTVRRVRVFKLMLQQHLSSNEGAVERTKIFTNHELDKATDHFNANRILGQGGQGTVYKGMLTDGRIVAIKKSKLLDESQIEEFINEVVILSQINHRNVVKLLGCCLETKVPLLVYEFIPNGTLSQHIHDPDEDFVINWEMRLKIAADSASAIAYLHSSSSNPIYHRDIKSSNILLDEKNRAKVSDFGISRTVSVDQTHLTTNVRGTFGYLDAEYYRTHKFTEKSDVYSFGVVLLELLTSKKAVYGAENMEQKSLATEFLLLMVDSRLSDILDPEIVKEAKEEQLTAFVGLAKRCLCKIGKLRPTMNEVAMTLEMIITSPEQVSVLDQQAFQDEEFSEDVMDEISDVSIMSNPLPGRASNPIYTDVQPLLPDTI